MNSVLHGAWGIIRAILGLDNAPKNHIKIRRLICTFCPDNKEGVCRFCGCILKFKTKLLDEDCDAGRWPQAYDNPDTFVPFYNSLTPEQEKEIEDFYARE